MVTDLFDGLFDPNLVVDGHHRHYRGVRTDGGLQQLNKNRHTVWLQWLLYLNMLTLNRLWCHHSVRSACVPPGPPVRLPGLAGRWSWILQPPELDTSPKHTYVQSVWWSHDASWSGRTWQHPARVREAGSLLTPQLRIVKLLLQSHSVLNVLSSFGHTSI